MKVRNFLTVAVSFAFLISGERGFASHLVKIPPLGAAPTKPSPLPPPPPGEKETEFDGSWTGEYGYPENAQVPLKTVPFQVMLHCEKNSCKGKSHEPNAFGDRTVEELKANWTGSISGSVIFFKKTYDGTGGVSHSVTYDGSIMPGTKPSMEGQWSAEGAHGPFSLKKD